MKNNQKDDYKYKDEYYVGLDNRNTPLRIFYHKKPKQTSYILFPGASPFAEEHPQMINLGDVIRNLGYNVYVPRIPPLKELNIKYENVNWFVKAYTEIIKRDDVDEKKVSVVGISFGGSILLQALLDEKIKKNPPNSILLYGACYNIKSGLNFLLTGEIIDDNKRKIKIKPNEWGITVLFHNYLDQIDVGFNTSEIQKILSARVNNNLNEVDQLKQNLNTKDLDFIESILTADYNPEIEKISKQIIKSQIDSIKKISPSEFCKKIKMKIFLMHGANDSMVPYTESIKLNSNLSNSVLLISHLYEHKEISNNNNIITKIIELIKLENFFASFFKHNEN